MSRPKAHARFQSNDGCLSLNQFFESELIAVPQTRDVRDERIVGKGGWFQRHMGYPIA